jgi:prepilin-type N-terminal cleavage/methylation domain-containing protein
MIEQKNLALELNSPRRNSLGFTLVEVLISVTILATIAVIVSSSWGGNVLRYKTAQIKIQAVELLQKKILEIETEYQGRMDALPLEKQTGLFEGDKFKNYTWEWEAQEIDIPDISALVDPEGEDSLVVSVLENFRQYLNQSIKEVQVVVNYKNGKEKPYKFVVPIYMVNFDNQISLGVGLPGGAGGANPFGQDQGGGQGTQQGTSGGAGQNPLGGTGR